MFCHKCGEALEEGKAFCKNCGARAPATMAQAGGMPPETPPDRAATPPPPPGPGYGAGWQPPPGPSGQRGRAGLTWGIVAAVIIVLAGIGVGVYFGVFRDGDETAQATTTEAGSTGTSRGETSTTSGLTTSTGDQADTTMAGSSTTQTIPSLDTSTSSPATTVTTQASGNRYIRAAEELVRELEYDDDRIPELAAEINNTAPRVPTWVRDELSAMLDTLDILTMELAELQVPPAFEDPDYWLTEAVTHMANRIYATMQGVEVMWDTGKVSSAESYFNEGRSRRDAYGEAIEKYYESLPVE